jgi:hypothetical protein
MDSWFARAVWVCETWWSGSEKSFSPLTPEEMEEHLIWVEMDERDHANYLNDLNDDCHNFDDDAATELGEMMSENSNGEEIAGDETEANSSWNKKRARQLQLAAAREHKKKFKTDTGDLRIQFFEGFAADFEALELSERKPLLYRIAIERLESGYPWTLKNVNLCTKINEKTLRAYQEVWKGIGTSDLRGERKDVFEYYVRHKKTGPQMADPIAMWKMTKRADQLIDNGDGGKCSTIRSMFKNVALPEMSTARVALGKNVAAGAAAVFKRSYSAMQRLVKTITPHVRKGTTKVTQDRLKAGKNPVGAMSYL